MQNKTLKTKMPGRLVDTGLGVQAFVPNPLPAEIDYRPELVETLAQAEADLGRLRGVGDQLANPSLLIVPYMRREAVLSSRIEGTQSTLSDLFLFEVGPDEPTRHPDVREVNNYVRAMTEGIAGLDRLPLSLRLVRNLHSILMQGVRGEGHTPGEFRRHQNYIGAQDTPIQRATFVPPPVPEMKEALDAWEKFLHVRQNVPVLVQCAMLHFQFEAIHPFADGNGRVGRLLITLFLCERGRLMLPLLYLSAFFERYRAEYYDRLLAVSQEGDWEGWVDFFLRGVSSQSRAGVEQAGRILKSHQTYRERLQQSRATGPTLATLDRLFQNPYTTVRKVTELTGTTAATAQRIIDRLLQVQIVKEVTGQRWGRVFCAVDLLCMLESSPDHNNV